MVRLSQVILGLLTIVFLAAGCSQTCFVRECDYNEFQRRNNLPANLETQPEAAIQQVDMDTPPPPTVNDPERKPRYLSLSEAIALALQQGTVGSQTNRAALTAVANGVTSVIGLSNDDLVTFNGLGVSGSDSIRVLALNPAIVGAGIDGQIARFATQFTTSTAWTTTDEPVQGTNSLTNGQAGTLSAALAKPLPTGGVAGITFTENYRILAKPPTGTFGVLSPSYTSQLQVGFEQPLLRGYGTFINQILPTFPNSILFSNVNGRRTAGTEGILITRLRFNQSRAEFARLVNFQLLNVEAIYWDLYGAYVNLYSNEQALRLGYEAWKIGKARFDEGKIDLADYAPTLAQYQQFRANRLQALGVVLEAERTLRQLLGMPPSDGTQLVPCDTPTLAPYRPDWQTCLEDAMTLRPELVMARDDLKAKQLNLLAQRDFLLPDLRFTSGYTLTGLGTQLDGNGTFVDANGTIRTDNSLKAMASNHFNDWNVGLTLNVPLGFRLEHSLVRQGKLQLAQSYALLKQQEIKARSFLAKLYRQLQEYHKTVEALRQARLAFADEVEARFRKWAVGKITVDFLLQAQQQWAAALSAEYGAVVNYNIALAGLEFAKGTIQQYDSVVISEGPLPQCVQVRAVDHERDRTNAVVLREKAEAPSLWLRRRASGLPDLPAERAPALPGLFDGGVPGEQANGPQPVPALEVQRPLPVGMGAAAAGPAPALAVQGPSPVGMAAAAGLAPAPAARPQLGLALDLPDAAVHAPAVLGAPVSTESALPLQPAPR